MYKYLAFSNIDYMFLRSEWETWNDHNYLHMLIFRVSDLWSYM